MSYLIAKSLHIIGFTCWFAGLFYIVRLFIYDMEAREKSAQEEKILIAQLQIMQQRLWYGITWPSMVVTLLCGLWLTHLYGSLPQWLIIKLTLILLLVCYHLLCGSILKKLRSDAVGNWSSRRLRMLNEVATVFLVFIVFTAVFKQQMTLPILGKITGTFFFLLVGGFLLYQKMRKKSASKLADG
ncbi:MAG: CopD family protein [Myxococcota bacterium]|nr:CopD family protein [Myxococcota bacterium]